MDNTAAMSFIQSIAFIWQYVKFHMEG